MGLSLGAHESSDKENFVESINFYSLAKKSAAVIGIGSSLIFAYKYGYLKTDDFNKFLRIIKKYNNKAEKYIASLLGALFMKFGKLNGNFYVRDNSQELQELCEKIDFSNLQMNDSNVEYAEDFIDNAELVKEARIVAQENNAIQDINIEMQKMQNLIEKQATVVNEQNSTEITNVNVENIDSSVVKAGLKEEKLVVEESAIQEEQNVHEAQKITKSIDLSDNNMQDDNVEYPEDEIDWQQTIENWKDEDPSLFENEVETNKTLAAISTSLGIEGDITALKSKIANGLNTIGSYVDHLAQNLNKYSQI